MKKSQTTYERLTSDPIRKREIEQEGFFLDLTEFILTIMERKKISRAELARRMGVSRSAITQDFKRGIDNITVRKLYKIANALDFKVKIELTRNSSLMRRRK